MLQHYAGYTPLTDIRTYCIDDLLPFDMPVQHKFVSYTRPLQASYILVA